MFHEQFEHQNVANSMVNDRFELKNATNTVDMAASSLKMLHIAPTCCKFHGKWVEPSSCKMLQMARKMNWRKFKRRLSACSSLQYQWIVLRGDEAGARGAVTHLFLGVEFTCRNTAKHPMRRFVCYFFFVVSALSLLSCEVMAATLAPGCRKTETGGWKR